MKKETILKSIKYCEENNIFSELNKVYDSVPKGNCKGCGNCCMESVGINLVEFLNIYNYLQKSNKLKSNSMNNIFDYYFLEYVKKLPCPFKDENNRCSIYEVRPLNCRIYGHWIKDDYNNNLNRIKKQNIEFAKYMGETYGLTISDNIVNYKIYYCEDFKPYEDYMSKDNRLSFSDRIVTLDSKLYSKGIMNINFKDRGIVEYFIESIFNEKVSSNIKIKITKDNTIRNKTLKKLKKIFI
ncbi:MAG TPA: YkgJ family cysteine cluster protein [Peptostreptococcaceae bacterium]|nr:YkgJ family cysteine cluster protein [Peptostreptococcaceae bacterium]